jgi:hypothetical protein
MVWNIGPLNECKAQSAIIPLVGIMIRKQYELRQKCHFVFVSRRVATKKATLAGDKNVLPVPVLTDQ